MTSFDARKPAGNTLLYGLENESRLVSSFVDFVWGEDWGDMSKALSFMPTVLLVGPTGTGKTTLLENVISSKYTPTVSYYKESLTRLVDKELGQTSKNVENLFNEVVEKTERGMNVYLQIDDIDSILSSRRFTNDPSGVRRAVNTFLHRLDSLKDCPKPPVVVATTNLLAEIDAAIVRRFSLQLQIDPKWDEDLFNNILAPVRSRIFGDDTLDSKMIVKFLVEQNKTVSDLLKTLQFLYVKKITGDRINTTDLISELTVGNATKNHVGVM